MDECVQVARALGERIGAELQVPIYFYEYAATCDARRSLANIRTGEYEGLERKLLDPSWQPDAGPARFDPRYGASVVGAREFLLAYNVNLNTRDKKLAHEIALNIREGGRLKRDAHGNPVVGADGKQVKQPGRLQAVRAIGWYIDQYRQAQVSINLLNYNVSPLHVVFETVREEAEKLGLIVTGSELVGMTPLQPMIDAGRFYLDKQGKSTGAPEADLIEMAVRSLGLDQVAPFEADKKIIEYQFRARGPLVSMAVDRFVDEVSSDSPAPLGNAASSASSVRRCRSTPYASSRASEASAGKGCRSWRSRVRWAVTFPARSIKACKARSRGRTEPVTDLSPSAVMTGRFETSCRALHGSR